MRLIKQVVQEKMPFKEFSIIDLVAVSFGRAELFVQFL